MASKVVPMQVKRRTLYTVTAVAVVASVVVAGFAYYLDLHRYPSEDTPLVLQSWGISWIREQEDPDILDPAQPFESLRLLWSRSPSTEAYGTPPLNRTNFLSSTAEFEFPANLTALDETYSTSWQADWLSDPTLNINAIAPCVIFIVDENGNGLFDYGDIISLARGIYENGTLTQQGFLSGTEYGIGLEPGLQFKFAVHHGKLYAWGDNWCPYRP